MIFIGYVERNLEKTPFTLEKLNNITMLILKGKVKIKVDLCRSLEELEEGTELVIVEIKDIVPVHRDKLRYIKQFENM